MAYTFLRGAQGGNRTRTPFSQQGILSPSCLPIPPPGRRDHDSRKSHKGERILRMEVLVIGVMTPPETRDLPQLPSLIVFDLDDTLAESKQPLEEDMAELLRTLLRITKVAVISGGHMPRFKEQFLPSLGASDEELRQLILTPTCGMSLYTFSSEWRAAYTYDLTAEEKKRISQAFEEVVYGKLYDIPEIYWGEILEDRGTMVAFAGLGSAAPVPEKRAWDPDKEKRLRIRDAIVPHLGDAFEVRVSGTTSIDITRKGIDKAYGVRQLEQHSGIPIPDMIFIGDALYEGGNDHPVISTGIRVREVRDHHHTKEIIRELLS